MTFAKPLGLELKQKIKDLQGRKVLIFGDVGIDEYVQGEVARISPEAPVPVVEVSQSQERLGLAANVAANVQSLGGEALLFSLVGDDSGREQICKLLKESGISTDHLIVDAQRKTTRKLRVLSGHHHIVRVDYESKTPFAHQALMQERNRLIEAVRSADCVVIQDYAKGLVNQDTCQMLISIAKEQGKPLLIDPYRNTPLTVYKGCQFMTPNRDEAMELAKQIPRPEIWDNIDRIGEALMEELQAPQMVITLGAQGMQIFSERDSFSMPTFAKKVFDVTGAGDTVIASFALGQAAGWSIELSALLANLSAGVVVGSVGAVACQRDDVLKSLESALNQLTP